MEYRIAVCDDQPAQLENLTKKLSLYAEARHIKFHIQTYPSAEAFLFDFSENRNFDLLFLDIEMAGMNGIQLARKIRAENETVQLCFITGYPDYMNQGYDVNALHYLLKPVSVEKLFEVCDRFLKSTETQPRFFLFSLGKEVVRVYEKDLYYGEAQGHYMLLHTRQGELKLRTTVPELEKQLGEGFFRPSRSFLVNLRYVTRITKSEILLEQGVAVPLGKGMFDQANTALIAFLRNL
ncbi:MAG: response regulator transcription factor [Clostridia bacterium]|nr:response regulator transcription factor [Clostridia bacterium]